MAEYLLAQAVRESENLAQAIARATRLLGRSPYQDEIDTMTRMFETRGDRRGVSR